MEQALDFTARLVTLPVYLSCCERCPSGRACFLEKHLATTTSATIACEPPALYGKVDLPTDPKPPSTSLGLNLLDRGHQVNASTKACGSTCLLYPEGNSKFHDRKLAPGGSDVDSYSPVDHVEVKVQVDGASFGNHFTVVSDQNVIAEDTPGNKFGVDFWPNDGKGNSVKTNPFTQQPSSPLVTIFGPGSPPSPSPSPSPPASPSPTLAPRDEGCKSPGYCQKSARLSGSSSQSNWNADCKAHPFSPNKYKTLSGDDTSCADTGIFTGERGMWQVHFPADIKGVGANTQHFYQPDRCRNVKINIWGEFGYPAFLLALLHSARDQAEIQLRNTAIQAVQPPTNSAGRNVRTSTRF
ncbi:hypothetical protein WJX74_002263 [Apatococcus lobatus]|uniref:Uncharacterized protein n=1 Tax=Apatococcus lobatus TaxID=904363 RepID=A0AAW1QXN3_9CHLO